AQFVTNRSDARAAHAHAGADGIDALVVGDYGDLGAHTGITGCSLDLEQALLDFRHFVLEQLTNKFRGCARMNQLLAAGGVIDTGHPGTNSVTNADVLAGYRFGARQARFNLACIDDGVTLVHALDRAGHNGFTTLEEVVEHLLTLGIADALKDCLLGSLCAD